jgi:hypothetical protein
MQVGGVLLWNNFKLSQGYEVSTKGFKGPWVTSQQVQGRSVRWRGVNVVAAQEGLWGVGR